MLSLPLSASQRAVPGVSLPPLNVSVAAPSAPVPTAAAAIPLLPALAIPAAAVPVEASLAAIAPRRPLDARETAETMTRREQYLASRMEEIRRQVFPERTIPELIATPAGQVPSLARRRASGESLTGLAIGMGAVAAGGSVMVYVRSPDATIAMLAGVGLVVLLSIVGFRRMARVFLGIEFGPSPARIEIERGSLAHIRDLYADIALIQADRARLEARPSRSIGPLDKDVVLDLEGALCPVCQSALAGEVAACADCKTPHHKDCGEYIGRCAVYACAGRLSSGEPASKI